MEAFDRVKGIAQQRRLTGASQGCLQLLTQSACQLAFVWHSLSPLPSPLAPRPSLPSLRMKESCGPFVEAKSGLGETSSGAAWAASARGGSLRPTAGGARKHPRSATPQAHSVLAFPVSHWRPRAQKKEAIRATAPGTAPGLDLRSSSHLLALSRAVSVPQLLFPFNEPVSLDRLIQHPACMRQTRMV